MRRFYRRSEREADLAIMEWGVREGRRVTVTIPFVREALLNAQMLGYDVEALLSRVAIQPELFKDGTARIAAQCYGELWRTVAQAMNDEFLGMDAHGMKVGSFSTLCQTVLNSSTLKKGIGRMLRFFSLVLDEFSATLECEGNVARIVMRDEGPPRRSFAYGTLFLILHRLSCWLIKRHVPVQSVAFRAEEQADADDYRMLFCPDVRFCQPRASLSFDASYLGAPVLQTEAGMKQLVREAPGNLLMRYVDRHSVIARVRAYLRALPPAEWPDFDKVASDLAVSASTLRRRLAEEGRAYQDLKDELRLELAMGWLRDPKIDIPDVASLVGFREPSAFYRAFKKWTGASPGRYRRQNACA
jgi:AraC-like DNA-binding protein